MLMTDHHLTENINCLEMLAMFRTLKHFLPHLRGNHVLFHLTTRCFCFFTLTIRGYVIVRTLVGTPDPPVGLGESALPEGSIYPWAP